MKVKSILRAISILAAGVMALSSFTACSDSSDSTPNTQSGSADSEKAVLRVGMECVYAPFNWTQVSAEVPNGDTAVEIYGGGGYAYGYDVMVAKLLAEELGMDLEIHKVEWDSIGLSMDSGEYDCIGNVYAAGIIAEIGDINRFPGQASVAKYAGLAWTQHKSGDFDTDDKRLVKSGNHHLRYYLCEAANALRRCDPEFKRFYDLKYKEVTKHNHKRALALTARKLVRLVYTLLKTNRLYIPSEEY